MGKMEDKNNLVIKDFNPETMSLGKIPLYITEIDEKEDRNGYPFCIIGGIDRELNRASFRMFQTEREDIKDYIKQGFYKCLVDCSLYNGQYSYTIKHIGDKCPDIKLELPTDCATAEKIFDKIVNELKKCKTPLKNVAIKLYQNNKEQLLKWPAGKSVHHIYPGDLLTHMYGVIKIAKEVGEQYGANIDLLVIGAAVHDLGKLEEMNVDEYGVTDYAIKGQLFGHSSISAKFFKNEVAKSKDKLNQKEIDLVEHMILSHHGKKQYNAVVVPATKEAFILHYADMIDSRMWIINHALKDIPNGETGVVKFLTDDPYNFLLNPEI